MNRSGGGGGAACHYFRGWEKKIPITWVRLRGGHQ